MTQSSSKLRRHALTALAASLTIAQTQAVMAQPPASIGADLDGVWKLEGDHTALRTSNGKAPPLRDAAKRLYAQRAAAKAKGDHQFDPTYQCKPPGEPRIMFEKDVPFQIIQTPKRIVFLYQWNRLLRVVDIQPQTEVIGPEYFGQNAGSWNGSTLEIDTVGLNDSTLLDATGLPHSEDLHLIERFNLKDADTLEVTFRFDDPKTFTAPWETKAVYRRQSGARIVEDVCIERMNLVGKLKVPDQ